MAQSPNFRSRIYQCLRKSWPDPVINEVVHFYDRYHWNEQRRRRKKSAGFLLQSELVVKQVTHLTSKLCRNRLLLLLKAIVLYSPWLRIAFQVGDMYWGLQYISRLSDKMYSIWLPKKLPVVNLEADTFKIASGHLLSKS